MLVFRNQTSYDRFWQGQNQLTTICTSVRNLTRSFLTCSYGGTVSSEDQNRSRVEREDTETAVRYLLALLYAVKTHLRAEWGATFSARLPTGPVARARRQSAAAGQKAEDEQENLEDLLPRGMQTFQEVGLGLPLQLSIAVEGYIKRGHDRGWFHAPQASQLTVQLNTAIASFGNMETIRLTPIPVAYLIHMKQVLALFGCVLPFALVGEMGWWTVLIVSLITFTLYGIEGIGQQLEDPFGYDKNDIKMDAIVEDVRVEVMVMLDQWRMHGTMFKGSPQRGGDR
jgi:putative membrane protein